MRTQYFSHGGEGAGGNIVATKQETLHAMKVGAYTRGGGGRIDFYLNWNILLKTYSLYSFVVFSDQ